MNIALVFVWPNHIDFPLFRHRLVENKDFFTDIYCYFSNSNLNENYESFVMSKLPFVTFINLPKSSEEKKKDWRNEAVNTIWDVSKYNTHITHYVFIEEDFLIRDSKFWQKLLSQERSFVYYSEGGRIHPAFTLVRKDLIEKTSKDFSANPPEYDHFGKFFRELKELDKGIELQELGFTPMKDYYHMAGLTQNYFCYDNQQPFYKPPEFLAYNWYSTRISGQNMHFLNKELGILANYGKGDSEGFLKLFFPWKRGKI